MVENLINLNKLKKDLHLSFKKDDEKIFSSMKSGFYTCPDISFTFDGIVFDVSLYEILDTISIIKQNKEHKKNSSTGDIPLMPYNSFIFANDIGGDFFIFNLNDSCLYYCGEINFYSFSLLSVSIIDLMGMLSEKEDPSNFIFKFSEDEIKLLTNEKGDILLNFLQKVNYGITDIKFSYSQDSQVFYDTIDFIYGFDYMKSINSNDSDLFVFGKTLHNKEIALNVKTGYLYFYESESDIVIAHYLSLFQ